jgi:CCR4-NOT transcription complex subunit 1
MRINVSSKRRPGSLENSFSLEIAALASRKEYLNLDKWLADNGSAHGAEFLHSVIDFLDQKMQNEKLSRVSDPSVENRTMALSPHTITIFLRTLRNRYVLSFFPSLFYSYSPVRV